ncbi:M23 family metallopeptidase [Brackiella oedipodis]|uniref:M23 family metallopeptidase n=1 Tax=Brackiella oedipodis TaxID=124225 RepID=UPI00048B564A|nr:peptidoglycan DD-metalloendopeptidase family protein [Brackiella oedipodis]
MKTKVLLTSTVLVCSLLTACGTSNKAPISSAGSSSTGTASSGGAVSAGQYVVQRGDTLYSIARRNGMNVAQLKSLNNLTSNDIEVGQRLRIGSGAATAAPARATASTSRTSSSSAAVARAADASKVSWDWPVRGNIITNFSNSTRGIDIAGSVGTPIKAAADGVVSYTGNGLRGLGNLVLITHSSNFITAYAHNSKITVKANQKVKKGDKIAELGQSDAASPRLHFEIRRNGTPVNPTAYLPK